MQSVVGSIRNLNWSYRDKPLFTNVSTDFPSGAFISIIGPNGSGKTTLLRHFLRILPSPKGTIILPDGDLQDYQQIDLAKHISYVPQQSRLEYDFTVYECIAMGRYAHGGRFSTLTNDDHLLITKAMEAMELTQLEKRLATELSGGEYQRMLIARALAQQSSVILLDEPVSHLDVHNQREILSLLRCLVEQKITTVVCVLHDLNAVSAFSDLVIMMDSGKIVAEGSVEEVLTKERIEEVYKVSVELHYTSPSKPPLVMPKWR
ncbi:MAG: ABC transporter ATP-binding protein [Sphaerochaetaceae bacterium]|jgi:iron complex transport system ATP-binding protein|nr:ABC transporter ATP-binding protein [Sphaerochaetaceae bacterium]MDD4220198.1 ABC transporter ATP-binding protein [Sphaerochaetaceae bacterium]MDY0372098.1 ABC transporter ATP-binding protein [Sphaerochaetaceae bacterium]